MRRVWLDTVVLAALDDAKEILETTKSDKKMIGGKVKFTLLKRIGEAYSDLSLTDDDLLEAIHYVLGR